MYRFSLLIACALIACEAPITLDEAEQPLGGFIAPVVGRWLAEPIVYRQYIAGGFSAGYGQAWQRQADLGYHPASLEVARVYGTTRYSGLWYRNDRVLDWASHRDQTEAEYLASWDEHGAAGFRLIDLDAHTVANVTRYHSVWVHEASPKQWRSNRRLTQAALTTALADNADDGYRPIRINAYDFAGEIRYAAVWVKDGILDFETTTHLLPAQFNITHAQRTQAGYVLSDVSLFTLDGTPRLTAIWTRDARVKQAVVRQNLNVDELEEANEIYTKTNLVMVDLNASEGEGDRAAFTAIWHRTEDHNLLQSNRPLANDADLQAITTALTEFTTNGNDGKRATMGFFVQDLQTGHYLTLNADAPFYLASTSKIFIGARVAAHPNLNLATQRTFNNADWRGENTRGFTQNNLGQLQTLQTYLTNMLIGSDTASTDVLHGILVNQDGQNGLNDWLRDVVGMQNVGEITDICTLDKRISAGENTCVNTVSCDTFETFFRGAGGPYFNASQAERDCLDSLVNDRSVENHETYYTSLANTVTPAEFGRFWQKLADGDLMSTGDRAAFLATLDPSTSLGFNTFQGVYYDQFATKNGGKRRVASQVGIMWDWNGAANDYTRITPRFAFAMFSEDWSFEDTNDANNNGTTDDTDWALTGMSTVLTSALRFLDE